MRSMVPFQGQKEGDNHIVSCVGDIRGIYAIRSTQNPRQTFNKIFLKYNLGNNEKGHFLDLAYTWVDMNSDLFGKKKEQNRIDVDLYQVYWVFSIFYHA